VLVVGAANAADLAQFATGGASVTAVDRCDERLQLAASTLRVLELNGRFVRHDAARLPFCDGVFDLVYAGPPFDQFSDANRGVSEIRRVLKHGGRVSAVFFAERSIRYWQQLVWNYGVKGGELATRSMADIISRRVARTGAGASPDWFVNVYTRGQLHQMFASFDRVRVAQRHISMEFLPRRTRLLMPVIERLGGWNLIVNAFKR
jgi:ubiquinone/menaquinone biosynthesis C-methylase UbiE